MKPANHKKEIGVLPLSFLTILPSFTWVPGVPFMTDVAHRLSTVVIIVKVKVLSMVVCTFANIVYQDEFAKVSGCRVGPVSLLSCVFQFQE